MVTLEIFVIKLRGSLSAKASCEHREVVKHDCELFSFLELWLRQLGQERRGRMERIPNRRGTIMFSDLR